MPQPSAKRTHMTPCRKPRGDAPDFYGYGLPQDDKRKECHVRHVHEGAALEGGVGGCPGRFEPGARHQRMLQAEQGDQTEINQNGEKGKCDCPALVDSGQWPETHQRRWTGEKNNEANPEGPHDSESGPSVGEAKLRL